jgi:hypothetical protein
VKRVLIISPHFPPINAPDMQRVRMSLPFYRDHGWDPVVLAVGEPWQDGVREPELLPTLPGDVPVVYVRALPLRWSRLLGIGNLGLRSWIFLFWRGCQLLRREKFDLVYFSTTQFATLSLGLFWRRMFKVPYVIDVQDPWRTDYYERPGSRKPPGGWKYQFARLQALLLEGRTFRAASGIISVSPSYLDDLKERYPTMARTPMAVIGFGASRGDIPHAMALPHAPYVYPRGDGQVHFLYTGASGPVMPHALTVLFTALRLYQERKPAEARRLRFHFIGTSYVAPGRGKPSVLPVAALCDVAANVEEIPHRIGHLEALRLQLDADVLLLPGSSDLAYSPSKIYPYYLTGRPILGLVFRDSVMERLLDELTCAYLVRFRQSEPKDHAYDELHNFFDLAIAGFPPGTLPTRHEGYFREHYLAETLTRRQCEIFDRAVGDGPPRA